ncbi:hypothetical protein OF83DRAFT_619724 [Amylostereum chailletii]|nr:hypothetical protein OF83DRAFT_619724 [Amylostereum chailletii]
MEDLQPNEARLARKGNTAVPRVRSTAPRPHHPSRGSNGRGRGRGHSNFSHRQNFASPKPRPFSQNTLPQDTPSFHSTPAQPHHTPRYPPFRNPPSIPTYTSSGDAKRRRIHPDGPTRAENWRSAAATSSNKTPLLPGNDIAEILARPPSKVRHKKHKSYPSIEIMLPPNCRKGVVNCKNERGNWLARLKIAMSTERKTVLHSDFSEKSVKLVYREEEGSDDSANAGPVPVEQTPLSLTSGRSEPTSVFSHTPAATLSQPSSVKPEPEPEISSKVCEISQHGILKTEQGRTQLTN